MAIYHFSVKTISRGQGRSAVACAAYRSGEKLNCDRYGIEQDYTKKTGVEFKKIYAPENTKEELLERQNLWNSVEKAERRKDATLAREFEIAFPSELNQQQREVMLDDLCQTLVKKHGVIVDACIHAPHTASGSDERNFHAHIMFSSRHIDLKTGDFAAKKNRDFNREKSSETVSHWREAFADLTNRHLEAAGHEIQVDHRSYVEQGNGLEATQHEGPKTTQLRRKGIDTEISEKNDAILMRNAEKIATKENINGLDQEIIASERLILDLKASKSKVDADVAQEQKNATERNRERNSAIELEQAALRANGFHALYQHFCNNFDKDLSINEQFKYVKNQNAFELAKQYVLDFELLKNNNQEPKPEKLSIWQKLKGEKEKEFIEIKSVKKDLDTFFPILFNDYSNFVKSKQQRIKKEEEQRIKRELEQSKKEEEQQQKILDLEKMQEKYNYPSNYLYRGLENYITNHIGLELLYVYENNSREYLKLSNKKYEDIERLYTASSFRKNSSSIPAKFVFEDVFKLIESDKQLAKDFMPSQLVHIQEIESKVKEYFQDIYEVKNRPVNSYQKNYNYDLENKPKPTNNNNFEM